MLSRGVMVWLLLSAHVWAQGTSATATSESTRVAGEYFIQKSGASWVYQLTPKTKGRLTITSFVDWKAGFTLSLGKRTVSGAWRVKDGAWLERSLSRGEGEMVVLPAVMTVGTRWQAPSSLDSGVKGTSWFEVISLDAVVDLPTGVTLTHCLAVLETANGESTFTHYYAPNIGKVGLRGASDWVYLLLEFRPGSRSHHE